MSQAAIPGGKGHRTGEQNEPTAQKSNGQPGIPLDAVWAELEKILQSPTFANADRQRRFLRFVVEQEMGGLGHQIKEYLLGVEVFDRGVSFDPRTDAVVRVEARSLRAKLADYYASEGRRDPLIISLPKGHYAPAFHYPEPLPPQAVSALSRGLRRIASRRIVACMAAVLFVAAAGISWRVARSWRLTRSSIAVLPFANLSSDPENEYFAAGLVEEVTTTLSKVAGLRVVARTSANQFSSGKDDVPAIGRKLRVGYVLEGSVRRYDGRVRVSAQLIRVSDSSHLWSEIYERDAKDVFGVQDEIAGAIARTLKMRLVPKAERPSATPPAKRGEAYNLYLKGQYFRDQRTVEGVRKSAALYEQAIGKDPEYAPAYAALADSYAMLSFHGMAPPDQVIPKAKTAVSQALKLDETNAQAHGALAWIRFGYDWDWAGAEAEFRRAIALDPNWANVHQWYAFGLLSRARFAEAVAESAKAQDLDPLSYIASNDLGVIYYLARRYDAAARRARYTLEMDPKHSPARVLLGDCLAARGRHQDAIAEYRKVLDSYQGITLALGRLGHAYGVAGQKGEARKLLDQLQRGSGQRVLAYVEMAYIQVGLGDRDEALASLEKAAAQRDSELLFLKVDPIWDRLRPDPRFAALVRKLGL